MKKLRKNGGFTLIEMLIVVAIIAILIAVSIPLINSALERARDATDQANERSAKTEAVLVYMGLGQVDFEDFEGGTFGLNYAQTALLNNNAFYYDAAKGIITQTKPDAGYGRCTGKACTTEYENSLWYGDGNHQDMVLKVGVKSDGEVMLGWVK